MGGGVYYLETRLGMKLRINYSSHPFGKELQKLLE